MSGDCPPTSPLRLPTPRCQSPKIWWSSAGSRWRTLVCFHPFPQVLQYTVVEATPIIVVFTQSVCVTRCRRSRCHQYRIAHYMNRLISLRRIYFLSRVPAVAGAVASVPAISTDRPSSRPSPESSSAQWFSQASPVAPDAPRASQPASASIGALSAHAGCVRRSASAASRARHSRFLGVATAKAKRRGTRFYGPPTGTSAISMRQPS